MNLGRLDCRATLYFRGGAGTGVGVWGRQKESVLGAHAGGRNSGMIHAGFSPTSPGSRPEKPLPWVHFPSTVERKAKIGPPAIPVVGRESQEGLDSFAPLDGAATRLEELGLFLCAGV